MLKKGDKVKVRNDLETQKFYGNVLFLPKMIQFKGKEVMPIIGLHSWSTIRDIFRYNKMIDLI